MRSYSSRVIVLPEDGPPTTYVLPALRETTFVCTFTLSNSVTRAWDISCVKRRSSSGEGLSWIVRAWTVNGRSSVSPWVATLGASSGRSARGARRADAFAHGGEPYSTQPPSHRPRPNDPLARDEVPVRRGCLRPARHPPMRREGTVVDLTEDELVAAIARVLETDDPRVIVGPGDDAAVTVPGSGELVLTTDLLVEGVHFERATISPHELGVKAIAVNVSDLAAMGASPRFALASVALTRDVERAWVIELAAGMREACLEYALSLVGGDTNRADRIVVSVTAVGEVAPGHAVTRGGARPGDAIVVTGSLGAAAGGLALSRV